MSDAPESKIGPPDPLLAKGAPPKIAAKMRRTVSPDVTHAASIRDTILDAAQSLAGPVSTNLASVLRQSAAYAVPVQRPRTVSAEMVVDIAALVAAIYNMESTDQPTAADWLREWVGQQPTHFGFREGVPGTGHSAVAGPVLTDWLFFRAKSLRDATMTNTTEPIGLRHLLFALAERPGLEWPPRAEGGPVTDALLYSLRHHIVERTGASPLPDEDMAAWREFLRV